MYCAQCGRKLPRDARFCAACGASQADTGALESRIGSGRLRWAVVGAVMVIGLIGGVVLFGSGTGPNPPTTTANLHPPTAAGPLKLGTDPSATPTSGVSTESEFGTRMVIRFADPDPSILNQAAETMRSRLIILEINGEVTIRDGVLVVDLPSDIEGSVIDRLRSKGELMTMRPVREISETTGWPISTGTDAAVEGWFESDDGSYYHLGPAALTSQDLVGATPEKSQGGAWTVRMSLSQEGRGSFGEITRQAAQYPIGDPRRQIAISVGNRVLTSPQVSANVDPNVGLDTGTAIITLGAEASSEEEARRIATTLTFGVLGDWDQVQVYGG